MPPAPRCRHRRRRWSNRRGRLLFTVHPYPGMGTVTVCGRRDPGWLDQPWLKSLRECWRFTRRSTSSRRRCRRNAGRSASVDDNGQAISLGPGVMGALTLTAPAASPWSRSFSASAPPNWSSGYIFGALEWKTFRDCGARRRIRRRSISSRAPDAATRMTTSVSSRAPRAWFAQESSCLPSVLTGNGRRRIPGTVTVTAVATPSAMTAWLTVLERAASPSVACVGKATLSPDCAGRSVRAGHSRRAVEQEARQHADDGGTSPWATAHGRGRSRHREYGDVAARPRLHRIEIRRVNRSFAEAPNERDTVRQRRGANPLKQCGRESRD